MSSSPLIDEHAERMVLGHVQMFPEDLGDVLEIVRPESFGYPSHGPILDVLRVVIERDGEVNYAAIATELHARGIHNAVGGVQYVNDCANVGDEFGFGVTRSSCLAAARLVAGLATRRALVDAAQRAAARARDLAEPVDDAADFAVSAMTAASSSGVIAAGRTFGEAARAVVLRAGDPGGSRASFPLPWRVLSQRIGNLRRKRLHLIGGRPAMGKSAMALNLALALSAPAAWWAETPKDELPAPTPVLMFSLEMGDEENAARGLATLAGVTAQQIEHGTAPAVTYQSIQDAVVATYNAPFRLDDKTRAVSRMRTVARQFFAKHGKGVLIGDYLQLMKASGLDLEKNHTRERFVAAMTAEFKAIAMDLDVAVVLLVQLKRTEGADGDRAPTMEDIRESGAAEQDADVILLLWGKRPGAHDLTQEINVRVEKVRGGAAGGDVPMIFSRRSTRFNEDPMAGLDAPLEEPERESSPDLDDRPERPADYAVGGYARVIPMHKPTGTDGGGE